MITGMKELQQKIGQKNIKNVVDKVMKKYTNKVVADAKGNAPSVIYFEDDMSQSTNVGSTIFGSYNDGVIEIEVLDDQAPYIEFGTGIYVQQVLPQRPKEWQDIAAQFIVNKQGTLLPSPYLYPAVADNESMISIELQKELND